ncbi:GATA zinc finger-domain-containing protein [Mycena rebaudengoi]|nr:GATA zinc finger-domain-containing protein [Mycena rebaudengoi]
MEDLLPCPSPSPSSSTSSDRLSRLSTSGLRSPPSCNSKAKECSHCHTTSTPLWRRDPTTHRTLCNACGLYLQQRNKMRPPALIAADERDEDADEDNGDCAPDSPRCSHCHTHRTSVWRRSKSGAKLCNACGVYVRLRGRDRPLSLRRNKIRPRCKHPKPS